MKKSRLLIALAAVVVALAAASCQKSENKIFGNAFGTYYNIVYLGENDDNLRLEIDSILNDLSRQFSVFDTNSLVSRLNRNEEVALSNDFVNLFNLAQNVAHSTNGAFDITVAPLVNLWGFGNADFDAEKITPQMIDSVRKFVGFGQLSIENGRLLKSDPRNLLNFNAIAKGYAVDKVYQHLVNKNFGDCLVDIGGEVRASASKGGKAWRVGIQIPTETQDGAVDSDYLFHLSGKAVATSGNYRNYHESGDERFSHIINPTTGMAEQSNLLSVTVIANDCATADAYATAFMVLGIEEAKAILLKHNDLAAHFIFFHEGKMKTWQTDNFPKSVR